MQPLAAQTASASPWRSRIGLELYTVRDLLAADFEGTLAKVADIGYTEVEPTSYNNMAPKDFRAMLDRLQADDAEHACGRAGRRAPSSRSNSRDSRSWASSTPRLRRQAPARGRARAAPDPAAARDPSAGRVLRRRDRRVRNAFTETEAFGPYQPPVSLDSVKRRAAQLNANGKIAQKYGMKMLVHNHTGEFEKLTDSPRTTFDVLVEETDPALVTMQLDLGWTYIAGVDPIALFKAHPGRFELWHVKDVFGLKTVNPSLGPNARVSSMALVPVGTGHIDFKPVFAHASLAGLKHFVHRAGQRRLLGRLARRRARVVSKPLRNPRLVDSRKPSRRFSRLTWTYKAPVHYIATNPLPGTRVLEITR